jgi:hypothetical protein
MYDACTHTQTYIHTYTHTHIHTLQEDSAILEATLREANKLLTDSGAPPLVDIGGVTNK